ncbi:Inorganic phosphate transporter [Datura stramonium]|uniref:Inorganic phosphate transporter n=1 Tax=Datura stramonium TaxID=4076 RepID=A0ABS8SJZ5_DATST|nr:Inorganic phosphate transporter [Datura stramonium]
MASDNLTVLNAILTQHVKPNGRLYYYDPTTHAPGKLPHSVNNWVTGVALVGTLTGQLVFGWLGDKLGRKKVYVDSLNSNGFGWDLGLEEIILFLLSNHVRENKRTRGAFIAAVFAMQGVGIIFAGLVSMIVSKLFLMNFGGMAFTTDEVFSTEPQADYVWRIVLMLGALSGSSHLLLANEDAWKTGLHCYY